MKRIDEFPTMEIDGISVRGGHVLPFGATLMENGGINFSINSADATGCTLLLFHAGEKEPYARLPFPEAFRVGNNYSMIVYDQNPETLEYAYSFDGRWDPEHGYRFRSEDQLLDPYAKLVSGRDIWGENENSVSWRGRIIREDFDWEDDRQLEIPMEDLIIYELHVRGFTADPKSGIKRKGTFAGIVEKIPYLKELGVNCIELLPIFEYDEMEMKQIVDGHRVYNYWGYSTLCFFAPKSGYAASGPYALAADELKNMVKQLHKNGIEVILDVVFNHTGERGSNGPTINYKGIDNRTYYLLDEHGEYCNYSACGNTVNCNNAVVRNHILDCLRYWVSNYHIDGFRFDEAPILSRDTNGNPMANPPLLEALAHDPILAKTKLIAEAWDAAGLYQVGSFPAPDKWAEWNAQFRECIRHFIKSDAYVGPELLYRLQGSPDIYPNRKTHATVNYVTCHDGFTMNDMVSYNWKHNMANGEYNRDGIDSNVSWNCGEEGPTKNPEIEALRNRQVKNACALLLLSRGVPMLLSGDEFRNTQDGNNNVYCQDGPISWLNWDDLNTHKDVFDFYRSMICLRNEHPVLRKESHFSGHNGSGYPELSFHGEKPWMLDMSRPFLTFGFMYAEPVSDFKVSEDTFIYCGVNAHWEEHEMILPDLPEGMKWYKYLYSADNNHDDHPYVGHTIKLTSRSLMVLIGKR